MPRKAVLFTLMLAFLAVVYVAGCNNGATPGQGSGVPSVASERPPEASTPASEVQGEHAHKSGAHGGNVVEIGRDNYHAEAVFEAKGLVHLYLLGQDETRVLEIETQTLTAYAKPEGGSEGV